RMDGLELTRRIRRNECLEDLPVLMQSASPLELLETRATAAGVTRLLPRTIRPKGLLDEITTILKADEPPPRVAGAAGRPSSRVGLDAPLDPVRRGIPGAAGSRRRPGAR